ncbi:MraY family glycosyltransferase [Bacillaceae bacterium S4-13-58]
MAFVLSLVISVLLTPVVKKLAYKIGAMDQLDPRKVHTVEMPRLGGLAIYISFISGFLIFSPQHPYVLPIVVASSIIVITGMLDDIRGLSPKTKLLMQIVSAVIVIASGVHIDFINLPFGDPLDLGYLSIPFSLLWVVGITNAINLIDGLDGLAAGISSIALLTISCLAILMGNSFVTLISFLLLGGTVGFLFYNFYPAKIFMGDTGSLFLGFMLAVISMLGFKHVTLFSFIVPIMVLGVPISDTLFAMVRRAMQKKPLFEADKAHLHHGLFRLGFSHPETVLLMYAISAVFSLAAVILSQAQMWGSIIVIALFILMIELMVEITGLLGLQYRPILNLFRKQ